MPATRTRDVKPRGAKASPASPQKTESLAALAKALAHPARLGVIRMLHERQTCIGCDIVDEIGLAQSTTSEQLKRIDSSSSLSFRVI